MKINLILIIILFVSCSTSKRETKDEMYYPEVMTLLKNSPAIDDIEYDPKGYLYISDPLEDGKLKGSKVYKVSLNDTSISEFSLGLKAPIGNAFDSKGNLYVANFTGNNVSKINSEGKIRTINGAFSGSSGLVINSNDDVFVANYNNNTILKINSSNDVIIFAAHDLFNGPVGLSLDEDEHLYVANYNDGKIFKVDKGSKVITEIAQISGPKNFVIGHMTYSKGFLYATGIGTHFIYKVSKLGEVVKIAGNGLKKEVDGIATKASFANPNGIEASDDGKYLFISDFGGNQSIRVLKLRNN